MQRRSTGVFLRQTHCSLLFVNVNNTGVFGILRIGTSEGSPGPHEHRDSPLLPKCKSWLRLRFEIEFSTLFFSSLALSHQTTLTILIPQRETAEPAARHGLLVLGTYAVFSCSSAAVRAPGHIRAPRGHIARAPGHIRAPRGHIARAPLQNLVKDTNTTEGPWSLIFAFFSSLLIFSVFARP